MKSSITLNYMKHSIQLFPMKTTIKLLSLTMLFSFAMATTVNAQNTFPSSGNVGIGTSTPQALLEVQAPSTTVYTTPGLIPTPRIRIVNSDNTKNNNGSSLTFSCFDAAGNISTGSAISGIFTSHATGAVSGDLAFQTRNAGTVSEVARFTAGGRVGIGITTPGSLLHLQSVNTLDVPCGDQLQMKQ